MTQIYGPLQAQNNLSEFVKDGTQSTALANLGGATTASVVTAQTTANTALTVANAAIPTAQINVASGVAGTDASNTISAQTVVATGTSTPRTLANRAASVFAICDEGAYGDLKSFYANIMMTSGANPVLTAQGASFVAADVGKSVIVPWGGASGAGYLGVITAVNSASQVVLSGTASTAMPNNIFATLNSSTVTTPGTGYAPLDYITLAGGAYVVPAVVQLITTQVVSATVASGGTGGTPGAVTITGTSLAGIKFQATGTINSSGVLTGPLTVTVSGSYKANPGNLSAEPVTGGGLVGATVTLVMGALSAAPTTRGGYSTLPTAPVAQASTTGSGTGAQFSVTSLQPQIWYGHDDSAAINNTIALARAQGMAGNSPQINVNAKIVFDANRQYLATESINATALNGLTIDFQNSKLYGATNGQPVLDLFCSTNMTLNSFQVQGDITFPPNFAMQEGITNSNSTAGGNCFYACSAFGYFSVATRYNFGAEVRHESGNCSWGNNLGQYCIIQDSINYWGVTSQFVTQTLPANTNVSFESNTHLLTNCTNTSPNGRGIWYASSQNHSFKSCYIFAQQYGIDIYTNNSPAMSAPYFDIHMEGIRSSIHFYGTNPTPFIDHLFLRDGATGLYETVFASFPAAVRISIREATVQIGWSSSNLLYWDNPSVFLFAGSIKNWNATGWVKPSQMNGWTELGTTQTSAFTYYGFSTYDNASIGGALTVAGATTLDGSLSVIGSTVLGSGGTFNAYGQTTFYTYPVNFYSAPTPTSATYSAVGLSVGWNATNEGEVDFFLGPQGGSGGLNMYQLNSSGTVVSSTPIFQLSPSGTLTLANNLYAVNLNGSGNLSVTGTASIGGTLAISGITSFNGDINTTSTGWVDAMHSPGSTIGFTTPSGGNFTSIGNTSVGTGKFTTLTATGILGISNGTAAAAGTNFATATQLTNNYSVVSSGTGGVILPTAFGTIYYVWNDTGSAITVYTPAGASLGTVAAGATGKWFAYNSTTYNPT
jgi:hypothetical protein